MSLRLPPRAAARLAIFSSALALLVSAPARGDDHIHSQPTPARAQPQGTPRPPPRAQGRGGLLLLSFLVPLPLPMALVAPPAASRTAPPAEAAAGRAVARPSPAAPVAARAGR